MLIPFRFLGGESWSFYVFHTAARQPKSGQGRLIFRFLDHTKLDIKTQARTHTHTPDLTSLNEWSARRRGCYLHNTQQTQENTSMPSAVFEIGIVPIKRPQTNANCPATEIGIELLYYYFSFPVYRLRRNFLPSQPAHRTVTYGEYYIRCCINTIWPPEDEHRVARNIYRIMIINVLYNVIVHQVGHLPGGML